MRTLSAYWLDQKTSAKILAQNKYVRKKGKQNVIPPPFDDNQQGKKIVINIELIH